MRQGFFRRNATMLIVLGLIAVLGVIGWVTMGQQPFVRTALSGLTIGALYFMVASGLTLIFGLMDVLNFAHGTMFMLGAYLGWQFYTNPTFLFGLFPLILALLAGLVTSPILRGAFMHLKVSEKAQKTIQTIVALTGIAVIVLAVRGLDILGLAKTAMVATMTMGNPLAEASAQEPLAIFWFRPVLMFIAGLLLATASARPGDRTQVVYASDKRRAWIITGSLLVLTVIATVFRESAPNAVLLWNGNLRFFAALVVGALCGAGLGAAVEVSLIRPLYIRPLYQVIVTLGLAYVLRETIQVLWDPLAYQMTRPPMFSQPGKAENILAWFSGQNLTVDVLGVTFPSYRLFIIVLGVLMVIALGLLMNYSRLGMIIRAGVQDRTMVEALGINVRRVFTIVFMLGAGLAALGGIGAAPFIPVQPNMGDAFQLQAFIVVVIGGMGSYSGAAIGALLLGLARAFGDYLALKYSLSPAIAEASTVIIMAIVLLVRPAGLFGKKE
ncbi:MAG: branched-chain amino acid ABC transporter permease [Bellilinea sp.]